LIKAVAEALEIDIPKPSKKATKKPVKKVEVEEEEEDEDEIEEEEEKPKKSVKKAEKETTSSDRPKCPHGHKFGIDTDDKKECDDCKIWGKCLDKKEGK